MGLRNPSGQSVIEYAVIIMIVIAAAVFGGPFLVNSINARFQIMENNTHDAHYEDLRQADVESGNVSCTCGAWQSYGCGQDGCGPLERMSLRQCSPLPCDQEMVCNNDETCCLPPTPIGCGDIYPSYLLLGDPNSPMPAYGDCAYRDTLSLAVVAPFISWTTNVYGVCKAQENGPPVGTKCRVGEKVYETTCGDGGKRTVCVLDPDCDAACTGQEGASQSCAGSTTQDMVMRELFYRPMGGTAVLVDNPPRSIPALAPSKVTSLQDVGGGTVGAWRVPFVFVANCSTSPARGCERVCAAGSSPLADATGCAASTSVPPHCAEVYGWDCSDFPTNGCPAAIGCGVNSCPSGSGMCCTGVPDCSGLEIYNCTADSLYKDFCYWDLGHP